MNYVVIILAVVLTFVIPTVDAARIEFPGWLIIDSESGSGSQGPPGPPGPSGPDKELETIRVSKTEPVPFQQFGTFTLEVQCPEGTKVVSGGYSFSHLNTLYSITEDRPKDNGWIVSFRNEGNEGGLQFTVYAECAKLVEE